MVKLNCWEFMDCGRRAGGSRVSELGTCPVTEEHRLDGVHEGINAGRSCWVMAGTLCNGKVQETFARKFHNCSECNFYKTVKKEEFPHFRLSAALMKRISK